MLLVVALSDCALRLSKTLQGASYVVAVRDGTELRHRVHQHQPDVLVLDWRMGGSWWRASDEVPAIVSRTATRPHVILVLPMISDGIEALAMEMGCYDVVSVTCPGWESDVAESVCAADRARQAWPAVQARAGRGSLH